MPSSYHWHSLARRWSLDCQDCGGSLNPLSPRRCTCEWRYDSETRKPRQGAGWYHPKLGPCFNKNCTCVPDRAAPLEST